jgi:hypothetical protein
MSTRSDRAAEASRLRDEGLTAPEVAHRMDISTSSVYDLWRCPEGHAKQPKARPCAFCGESMRRPGQVQYCSPSCRGKASWQRARVRTGRVCKLCGGSLNGDSQQTKLCPACRVEERLPLYRAIEELWAKNRTYQQIAEALGVSLNHLTGLVGTARRAGFDLPSRYGVDLDDPDLVKATTKQFKRERVTAAGRFTEKQKCCLRVLQAAPEPIGAAQVSRMLGRLKVDTGGYADVQSIYMCLKVLAERGAIRRVKADRIRWGQPKTFWFLAALPDREALTLEDARQETELAALIAEQVKDGKRGHYAETDYKAAFSLDGSIGEDGGTWHDLLEEDVA